MTTTHVGWQLPHDECTLGVLCLFQLHWQEEGASNTIIPLVSLHVQPEDQAKLFQGMPLGGTVLFQHVQAVVTIDTATCDKINTGG